MKRWFQRQMSKLLPPEHHGKDAEYTTRIFPERANSDRGMVVVLQKHDLVYKSDYTDATLLSVLEEAARAIHYDFVQSEDVVVPPFNQQRRSRHHRRKKHHHKSHPGVTLSESAPTAAALEPPPGYEPGDPLP